MFRINVLSGGRIKSKTTDRSHVLSPQVITPGERGEKREEGGGRRGREGGRKERGERREGGMNPYHHSLIPLLSLL